MELDLGKPFWNEKSDAPPLTGQMRNYLIQFSILPQPTNCSYIYLCSDTNTGEKKVIKFIKFIRRNISLIINEIEIMKIAHHSNILQIYDHFRFKEYMCLILPYTENRSLLTLVIQKYPKGIPEEIAAKLMQQMLKAVDYLHDLNICHRDIKPSNFLIFYDQPKEEKNSKNLNGQIDSNNSKDQVNSNSKSDSNENKSDNLNDQVNTDNKSDSNENKNSNDSNKSSILNGQIDSNNLNGQVNSNSKSDSNENNHSNDSNKLSILNGQINSNNKSDLNENTNDTNLNTDSKNSNNSVSEESNKETIPKVVLSDFGFAQIFAQDEYLTDYLGSPYFMAPEIHNGQPYDKSVDIWALGISLFYMLTRNYPLPLPTSKMYGSRLSRGKLNFKILSGLNVSDEATNLIKKMCAFNPKERITAKNALLDPWILSGPGQKTTTEREVLNDIGLTDEYNSIQGV